jgi:NADPH2:quinone reductase
VGGPTPPFVPGIEAAGQIEATGERVVLLAAGGACAQWIAAPRARLLNMPRDVPFEVAATLPVAYLTAFHAIASILKPRSGESMLVLGAGGGVGTAAVGIGRLLGVRVIAVSSTEARRARLRAMGADEVLSYDEIGHARPNTILDTVGGLALQRALRRLPAFGKAALVGAVAADASSLDSSLLVYRTISVHGLHLDAIVARPEMARDGLRSLLDWIASGELEVPIDDVLPFSKAAEGHHRLASRQVFGKLVLVPEAATHPPIRP